MRFQTNREDLLKALSAVIGAVEKLQTMPILSHVLLKAHAQGLELTGTDLRLELVAHCPAKVKDPASTTMHARKLYDICRSLPEGAELTGEVKEARITLKSGPSRFVLSTMAADEFPALEDIQSTASFKVEKRGLKRLLDRTHFAMAHEDDPRRYLAGLLLVVQKSRLRAVATDGHRMALTDMTASLDVSGSTQVIVPRKSVAELVRLLDESEGEVSVSLSANHLRVELDGLRFTTKLIEGRYPDYERVIPDGGDKTLTAGRDAVRQALVRTAILAKERFKGVRLTLGDNQLKLQTQNPEHEEAEEVLEVQYEGAPVEIGFNVTYLLDVLGCMSGERFSLELTGPDASGLVREVGNQDSRYVVMPMRL